MRSMLCFALAIVAGACSRESAPPPPQKAVSISSTLADPVDSLTDLPASCELSSKTAHEDPAALIQEFVDRDAGGQFLESSTWLEEAAECPGHVSGWDAHPVITSYIVRPLAAGEKYSSALVTYKLAGTLGAAFHFDTATVADTVIAHKTPYGWRVVLNSAPHVSYQAAFAKGLLTAADTARISAAIGR